MKMLELFCGTKSVSKEFEKIGWETYTVDWDDKFNPTLKADISKMTYEDMISLCGGKPDVIWASPDCTTYSIAGCSTHRYKLIDCYLPKTDYAKFCDNANVHLSKQLEYFVNNGSLVFVENPRGIMRKMNFWKLNRYTVTYCQYGDFRQKPTDIWTNHTHPDFKPCCKVGDSCHESAPRGSKKGTQSLNKVDGAKIPVALAKHIAYICDDHFKVRE